MDNRCAVKKKKCIIKCVDIVSSFRFSLRKRQLGNFTSNRVFKANHKVFTLVKNNILFRIYIGKLVGSVRVFIQILFPSNIGVSTATRARASYQSWLSGYCCSEFVCIRVFQVEKPVENIVSHFPSLF